MQHRSIYVLLLACWLAVHAFGNPQPDKITGELLHLQEMQITLDDKGLWGFLAHASEQGWTMPWIRSDYWVDGLPAEPKERVNLERAKRSFGFSLAKALDSYALQVIKPADAPTRAEQADKLLNAAAWLRESHGYGNLLLSSRAENLACVPIGYLVADLSCDTNTIDAFMVRLSTPEADLDFRLDVLNEEAPLRLTVARDDGVKKANDELDLLWNRGHHSMMRWCKDEGVARARDKRSRQDLPAKHAFFSDDEASHPPYTTTEKWDQKQHQSFCVYGGYKGIRKQIDTLYLFRQKVGSFPSTPPAWFGPEEKIYTAIQAAFTEAWMPFMREYGPQGRAAAGVYEAVQDNRLMDWDTSQLVESLPEEQDVVAGKNEKK